MNNNTPVITGASAVCSLGTDLKEIVSKLIKKETGFTDVRFNSEVINNRLIAPVDDVVWGEYISDRKTIRLMAQETKLAVSALKLCLADSGIVVNETYKDTDIAIFAGTGTSGIDFDVILNLLNNSANENTGLFDSAKFGEIGLKKLNPMLSFKILPNMPPSVGSINAKIKGNNLIFNPWEGNALLAITEGYYEIKSGRERIVFCGGSDCKTHSNAIVTLEEFGIFDDSDIVLSEGSSYLSVENYKYACDRDANILCKITNITNHSPFSQNPLGYSYSEKMYSKIIEKCLSDSELQPDAIDLIIDSNDFNHKNDDLENKAIDSIFSGVKTISPKKIIGNAFAASGFISLAIASCILGNDIEINGKNIERILINSFSIGSEKFSIILEKI